LNVKLGSACRANVCASPFLPGDSLYRLDQIGDQVGPALELGLDLTFGLVDRLVHGLDRVVATPGRERRERDE
jgi:hypothetical protein